jgi:hypothetical protein
LKLWPCNPDGHTLPVGKLSPGVPDGPHGTKNVCAPARSSILLTTTHRHPNYHLVETSSPSTLAARPLALQPLHLPHGMHDLLRASADGLFNMAKQMLYSIEQLAKPYKPKISFTNTHTGQIRQGYFDLDLRDSTQEVCDLEAPTLTMFGSPPCNTSIRAGSLCKRDLTQTQSHISVVENISLPRYNRSLSTLPRNLTNTQAGTRSSI